MKSRRKRWVGHEAQFGDTWNAYYIILEWALK
jgi:hypothetical protein